MDAFPLEEVVTGSVRDESWESLCVCAIVSSDAKGSCMSG